jgi:3-(3-hydroxy-phenyl)propionate hydroxylase
MSADFVIAGAGPVGLTAALMLARAGKSVLVVERDPNLHTDWRASTFHAPTLEMAEEMGVIDDMLEQGLVAELYQVRDWSKGRAATFDFTRLADATNYPYRVQLEQYKYARILYDRLLRDHPNVEVRFGCAAQGVVREGPRPIVRVEYTGAGEDGRTEDIECAWLLACDGANSAVRRSLGLTFEGLTYETRAVLLSINAPFKEWYPDICWVNYIADSAESPGMLLKIPDTWRCSFKMRDDVSDEEAVSDAYVEMRLREIFGDRALPPTDSRQIFRVHQRSIETFRHDHVLLLGDAAHINSPHGGMGMNSGIHDAFDLGRVLPAVTQGELPDTEIDAWAERRRAVALNDVQKISHRNMTEIGSADESTVNHALQRLIEISNDPQRAYVWMHESSMLTSVRKWFHPRRSIDRQSAA